MCDASVTKFRFASSRECVIKIRVKYIEQNEAKATENIWSKICAPVKNEFE